jgi:hypothetical protein
MSKIWKCRISFLVGIFTPFIAIEFLPWWLGVPVAILSAMYIAVAIKLAKEISKDMVVKETIDEPNNG